jgi:hypothetical protein
MTDRASRPDTKTQEHSILAAYALPMGAIFDNHQPP